MTTNEIAMTKFNIAAKAIMKMVKKTFVSPNSILHHRNMVKMLKTATGNAGIRPGKLFDSMKTTIMGKITKNDKKMNISQSRTYIPQRGSIRSIPKGALLPLTNKDQM